MSNWEQSTAEIWHEALKNQQVVSVEPHSWPRLCSECNDEEASCWKCDNDEEEPPENLAVVIKFSNGLELVVNSPYAAALFKKVESNGTD